MAEFRIVVVVDPSGAKRGTRDVERQLGRVGDAADRTRRLIARVFAFVGVGFLIRKIIELADVFVTVQNRIKVVTDSMAELALVTSEVLDIANRSRTAVESTAAVFTRVTLAARDLGVSMREVLEFTETLNKAVILSGARTQEASAGMIQLAQAMASGTLRGDELRSVLEQLPVVADIIAKQLGVTRGELRALGAAGRINAFDILEAFKAARVEIAERFAKTIPTISQSFTVLTNRVIAYVGAIDKASGASRALSGALLSLSDNLDTVARLAAAAGIVLGVQLARVGIGATIKAVKALTLAIAANPLGALLVGVTAVIALLTTFSDKINIGEGRLASLRDLGQAVFEKLAEGINIVVNFFRENFGFIADIGRAVFGDVEFSIVGLVRAAARGVDNIVGFFVGAKRAIVVVWDAIPAIFEGIFVKVFNALARRFQQFLNFLIRGINRLASSLGAPLIKELGSFEIKAAQKAGDIGAKVDRAFASGFEDSGAASAALDRVLDRADEIARDRLARQEADAAALEAARKALELSGESRLPPGGDQKGRKRITFQQILDDLRKEAELLQLTNREREIQEGLLTAEDQLKRKLSATERDLLENQLRRNQALRDERELLDEIRGPQEEFERRLEALNRLMAKGAITGQEYADKLREIRLASLELARDLGSGLERGLLRIAEQFGNVAELAESTLVNAFRSMEDALVEFVTTGKTDFKSLVDSILADITRLAIRAAIIAPLANFFGGGFGGGGGGLGGLFSAFLSNFGIPGLAHGGALEVGGRGGTDRNLLSINNRPVARVSKGERVTVTPQGGGGGRPLIVNFNISTPDADSFARSQGQLLTRTQSVLSRAARRNT